MGAVLHEKTKQIEENEKRGIIWSNVRAIVLNTTSLDTEEAGINYENLSNELMSLFPAELKDLSLEDLQGKDKVTIIKEITEAIIMANTKKNIGCACGTN